MKKWNELIATCFYIGKSPRAPGTLGSLAGLLLVGICAFFHITFFGYIALTVLLLLAGLISSNAVARDLNQHDPQIVVIDEVVGMMATVIGFVNAKIGYLILGFLFFRIFDIWKPFPIRKLESLRGGLGIMADDLVAAAYAHVCLRIFQIFFP